MSGVREIRRARQVALRFKSPTGPARDAITASKPGGSSMSGERAGASPDASAWCLKPRPSADDPQPCSAAEATAGSANGFAIVAIRGRRRSMFRIGRKAHFFFAVRALGFNTKAKEEVDTHRRPLRQRH